MEHPINRSIHAEENDPALSVTALVVVLALLFISYFMLRAAVPELPLHVLSNASAQEKKSQTVIRAGAQPSAKGAAEYFTGSVRVDPLFPANESMPRNGADRSSRSVPAMSCCARRA